MKSKRVTKLLACVLSSTMIMAPVSVFASSTDRTTVTQEGDYAGSFETGFDVNKQTLNVTVPTKADIRINPTFKTGNTSVNGYRVASKDLMIENKTLDTDHNAIPVLLTAKAKIANKKDDVKVYYDASKYTPSSSSQAKEILMQLVSANGGDISNNNAQYVKNSNFADTADSKTVTTLGSLLQVQVPAATSVNNAGQQNAAVQVGGYAAIAVIGDANENAKWEKDDVTLELTYNLKATSATSTVATPNVTISSGNLTSGNAVSINIPDTTLDGSNVGSIVVCDRKAESAEWNLDDTVTWDRTTANDGYMATIPATTLDGYVTEFKKGTTGNVADRLMLLVSFTDGRVQKLYITIA